MKARWPLVLMAGLYFVLGFVTWANGPLISFVQVAFHLSNFGAFLVPMAFYLSYVLFAVPASAVAGRIGLKRGLALALLIMALGLATFARCIAWQVYDAALIGLFILGAGLAMLQVAINPYVSLLGVPERAAQRIAIMGICNKTAGILAPLALGAFVMPDLGGVAARLKSAATEAARQAELDHFTHGLFLPYLALATLLVVAAFVIARADLPEPALDAGHGSWRAALTPRLLGGVGALFLYVGVEVMAGDAIGTYARGFGLPLDQTKFFTSATLAAMLIGYLLGMVAIPRIISQERYMALSCALGVVLSAAAWLASGYVSVALVAALGFANAMIWPALFPLAIRGAGPNTPRASSLLVMAICGGAILPQLFVSLMGPLGFQAAFTLLVAPAYAAIMAYTLYWRRRDVG